MLTLNVDCKKSKINHVAGLDDKMHYMHANQSGEQIRFGTEDMVMDFG